VIQNTLNILVVDHSQEFIRAQMHQDRHTEVITKGNQLQISGSRYIIWDNKPVAIQKVEKHFICDSTLLAQNVEQSYLL
jgi:hypothetical protein